MNGSQVKKPIIAVFLNAFWINGQGMSGGDQMAIQIFRRIREGFSTLYWFSNPDGRRVAQQEMPDAVYSTTPEWFDRLPIGLSYILRTMSAIARLITKQVDIVYSGSDFFPDVLPAWIYSHLHPGSRWVMCIFHIYPHWRSRPGNKWVSLAGAMLQKLSLRLARRADAIVNINSQVRDQLVERGFAADRLTIITPGIDCDLIESVPPLADDERVYEAVFLGRLNFSKGIFDLPEIWQQVAEHHPDARLGIIGGGSEEIQAKLLEDIRRHDMGDRIELLGFVPSERIYGLLKRAKVFVFPSHEEGFGIAIVEALAARLPVVAWDLPVYNELFGTCVTQVQQGDRVAFAHAVCGYLDRQHDGVQAREALETARRYGWQQVAERMKQRLYQLVGEGV